MVGTPNSCLNKMRLLKIKTQYFFNVTDDT